MIHGPYCLLGLVGLDHAATQSDFELFFIYNIFNDGILAMGMWTRA